MEPLKIENAETISKLSRYEFKIYEICREKVPNVVYGCTTLLDIYTLLTPLSKVLKPRNLFNSGTNRIWLSCSHPLTRNACLVSHCRNRLKETKLTRWLIQAQRVHQTVVMF